MPPVVVEKVGVQRFVQFLDGAIPRLAISSVEKLIDHIGDNAVLDRNLAREFPFLLVGGNELL